MRVLLGLVLALAGCDSVFQLGSVEPPADVMIDAPIETGWKATVAGYSHSCGIRADDTLWCWGDNEYGSSGTGSPSTVTTSPTRVGTTTFTALSSGDAHTCAIATDRSLWCWGYNLHGELGIGSHMEVRVPTQLDGAWKQVSAGGYATCAIRDDETLWCWGYNYWGEAGINSMTPTAIPTQVGASTWADVDVGWYQTCGIDKAGTLYCWGSNGAGALGDPSVPAADEPHQIVGEQWKDVDVGGHVACGVTQSGALRCWGDRSRRAVPGEAAGTVAYTPQPVLVGGAEHDDWAQVSIDWKHGCAIKTDGSLWCWGDNSHGQLGVTGAFYIAEPMQLVSETAAIWRRVDTGYWHSCGIDIDNQLWCIGAQHAGQLGNSPSSPNVPTAMPGLARLLAAGPNSTCSTDESGRMLCAGYYETESQPTRVPVVVDSTEWNVLAPGNQHACGVTSTRSYCWGDNSMGQLGSNTSDSAVVDLGGPYSQLESSDHTCGIYTGYVYCWGYNAYGQVGNASTANTFAQTYVGGNAAVPAVDLAVGYLHTCAVMSNGTAYCWGRGYEGQLGGSNATYATTATLVTQTTSGTFASIAAGGFHTCALNAAGRLWCWGANAMGQLGTGDVAPRLTPAAIGTAAWRQVALGHESTCGIQSDGSLWCWGRNRWGQLGIGSYIDRYTPTRVGNETDWTKITSGRTHSCAQRESGEYWCWGSSAWGQVPDGNSWTSALVRVP